MYDDTVSALTSLFVSFHYLTRVLKNLWYRYVGTNWESDCLIAVTQLLVDNHGLAECDIHCGREEKEEVQLTLPQNRRHLIFERQYRVCSCGSML